MVKRHVMVVLVTCIQCPCTWGRVLVLEAKLDDPLRDLHHERVDVLVGRWSEAHRALQHGFDHGRRPDLFRWAPDQVLHEELPFARSGGEGLRCDASLRQGLVERSLLFICNCMKNNFSTPKNPLCYFIEGKDK